MVAVIAHALSICDRAKSEPVEHGESPYRTGGGRKVPAIAAIGA